MSQGIRIVNAAMARRIRRQCAALTEILGKAKMGFTPDTRDNIVEAHEKLLVILDTQSEAVTLLQRVHELIGKSVVQRGLPLGARNKLLACDREVHSILFELVPSKSPEGQSWLKGWWTPRTKAAVAGLVVAILTSVAVRVGIVTPESGDTKPGVHQEEGARK